jgi:hypothetical protein
MIKERLFRSEPDAQRAPPRPDPHAKKNPFSIRDTGIYRHSKPPSLSRKYVMLFVHAFYGICR